MIWVLQQGHDMVRRGGEFLGKHNLGQAHSRAPTLRTLAITAAAIRSGNSSSLSLQSTPAYL